MEPEAQLQWEARVGRFAALAAFGSAVFTVVSLVLQVALTSTADTDRESLLDFDDNRAGLIVSLAAQSVAYVLLVGALYYLLRVTQERRPETPRFAIGLLALAPVLVLVGLVLNNIHLADLADQFSSGMDQSEKRADRLLEGGSAGVALVQGGGLCLALSFVFVSLNAMKAGLLSPFMGILGVIIGALLVLPLFPLGQPFLQFFWVIALGLLFLDRWPGGRGPAWQAVEAIPWPSAAERREEGVPHSMPLDDPRDPEPAPDADGGEVAHHPVSKKRKRKRRR